MSGGKDVLEQLLEATRSARAMAPLAPEAIDVATGYSLQRLALDQRRASGERLSGWKIAFAGRAAQVRFGLDEPVYGSLTQDMHVEPGAPVSLAQLIQPKLEIELAFVLGRGLPAGPCSDEDILAAVTEVAPAFEIADCRWQGWRFGAGAFLADNAAAGRYCLGPRVAFDTLSHACVAYSLTCEGTLLGTGNTLDREDSPFWNLCWLIRRVLAGGHRVEAGQVVLSGSLLAPLDIQPATYRLRMLGTELALDFVTDMP